MRRPFALASMAGGAAAKHEGAGRRRGRAQKGDLHKRFSHDCSELRQHYNNSKDFMQAPLNLFFPWGKISIIRENAGGR